MEAIDSKSGISLADKSSVFRSVLIVQNSVSNRKAARVSDCKYISFNFDSMKDMH